MEQLKQLSQEELTKRKNKLKTLLISLAIIYVLLVIAVVIFYFVSQKMSVGTIIPLAVFPIACLPLMQSVKSFDEELKQRKNN